MLLVSTIPIGSFQSKTFSSPFAIHILMIQELKENNLKLNLALRTILPDHQHIISPPIEERGGAALLLHPNLIIISKGISEEGSFAWASILSN